MLSATTEQTKKNPKKDFEKKGSKKGFAVIRAGWLGWFETFFFFKSAVPLLLSAKLGFDKWGRTLR